MSLCNVSIMPSTDVCDEMISVIMQFMCPVLIYIYMYVNWFYCVRKMMQNMDLNSLFCLHDLFN